MDRESGISKMWRAMAEKNRPPTDPDELRLWIAKKDYTMAETHYRELTEDLNEAYIELMQRKLILDRLIGE